MTTTPTNENARWQAGADVTAQTTTSEVYPKPTNKRELRALMALLACDLTREQLDRTAGCSNSPDLVRRMRGLYGIDLPCDKEAVHDRDGCLVKRGVYRPTSGDRRRMRELLATEVRQ